ncbi:unnamed protein product [Linum trigynum]|uniref:Uncharacterized protein n=1 Tax=Linum trigynum TaxID=586398 RepID=A0AAV2CWD0_9ROSI
MMNFSNTQVEILRIRSAVAESGDKLKEIPFHHRNRKVTLPDPANNRAKSRQQGKRTAESSDQGLVKTLCTYSNVGIVELNSCHQDETKIDKSITGKEEQD